LQELLLQQQQLEDLMKLQRLLDQQAGSCYDEQEHRVYMCDVTHIIVGAMTYSGPCIMTTQSTRYYA